MIKIEISGDTIDRITRALAHIKNGMPKAVTRGINEALDKGRTECVRAATARYLIKPSDIRASLSQERASYGKLGGAIRSKSPNLPLIKFQVRPPGYQQRRKKKRPVTASVLRGGGGTIEQGFVYSGGMGRSVGEREGDERVPLKQFFGPGPAVMLGVPEVSDPIEAKMRETLEREIERQAQLLLSKA